MIVDFPDPEGPTSAVTVPGSDRKLIPCSTSFAASYEKCTSANSTSTRDSLQRHRPPRVLVFLRLVQNLPRPFQPRHRLGQLRPNRHNLKHRRDQHRQKHRVGKEHSHRHRARPGSAARPGTSPPRSPSPSAWPRKGSSAKSPSASSARCQAVAARRAANTLSSRSSA